MGAEVKLAAYDSSLQLGRAVTPVTISSQNPLQVCHQENNCRSVMGQRLLESQMARFLAKVSFFQLVESRLERRIIVGSARHLINSMDNQVKIKQAGLTTGQKIGRNPSGCGG